MNLEKSAASDLTQPPPLPLPLTPETPIFYVVAKEVFILFIVTFSFYSYYWFWKQWNIRRKATGEKMWPIARAIFAIFFVYSLFEEIELAANKVTSTANPRLHIAAVVYIIGEVLFKLLDKISPIAIVYLASTLLLVGVMTFSAWQAQSQANIASLDAKGKSNSGLTPLNYIWIALGTLLWLLIIVGTFIEPFTEI